MLWELKSLVLSNIMPKKTLSNIHFTVQSISVLKITCNSDLKNKISQGGVGKVPQKRHVLFEWPLTAY